MAEQPFTSRRFQALRTEQQHRLCSKLLYSAYLNKTDPLPLLLEYEEWASWMDIPAPTQWTAKEVADRYHWHRREIGAPQTERFVLPKISRGDRPFSEPCWPIAIVLERLRSAHNVGSILRTTEAFSLGTLYFSSDTPDPRHVQVRKTAMGTESWVSFETFQGFASLPKPVIALETCEVAHSLFEFSFPTSFTLVVGNEEDGVSETTLQIADAIVAIPLRGRKNSINVANAFAIVAAEIARQREVVYER